MIVKASSPYTQNKIIKSKLIVIFLFFRLHSLFTDTYQTQTINYFQESAFNTHKIIYQF